MKSGNSKKMIRQKRYKQFGRELVSKLNCKWTLKEKWMANAMMFLRGTAFIVVDRRFLSSEVKVFVFFKQSLIEIYV